MAEAKIMTRVFKFNGMSLPDPDVHKTVEEVKEFYSGNYPALNNATVKEGEIEGENMVYNFVANLGTKG